MTKIEQAIEELKKGNLIVLSDDEDRENEGDLIGLPEFMTAESINFMITEGKGLLCAPVSKEVAIRHNLTLSPQKNSDGTNFMESIDAPNSTTGISAQERMDTFNSLILDKSVSFRTPGHLFPLLAKDGGLSKRRGHTEAAVDLAKLAGSKEVGAIIEIIKEDGSMARRDWLDKFSKKHNLVFATIEDLVSHIEEKAPEIWETKEVDEFVFSEKTKVPTLFGELDIQVAKDPINNMDFTIISKNVGENPIVRIHSACITSETFGSKKCDCKVQLDETLKMISEKGGMIIYTPEEGRGIGIFNKINAYSLQEKGRDTVQANKELGLPADNRKFDKPAKILKQLNIKKIKLLTNNPEKVSLVESFGIEVERQSLWTKLHKEAEGYIQTKIKEMNHIK